MDIVKKLVLMLILFVIKARADFAENIVPHFTPVKLATAAGMYVAAEALFDYYKSNDITKNAEDGSQEITKKNISACFFDAIFSNKRSWTVIGTLFACYLYKVCEEMPVEKGRPCLPLNTRGVEFNLCLPPEHSSIKKSFMN